MLLAEIFSNLQQLVNLTLQSTHGKGEKRLSFIPKPLKGEKKNPCLWSYTQLSVEVTLKLHSIIIMEIQCLLWLLFVWHFKRFQHTFVPLPITHTHTHTHTHTLTHPLLSSQVNLIASSVKAAGICYFVLFGIAASSHLIQTVSLGSLWHTGVQVAKELSQRCPHKGFSAAD